MGKVEMVKAEAIIDLQIGSKFLQDLQGVIIYLSSLQPVSKLQDIVTKANTDAESLDQWEKSIYTMLVLVTTIEENAKKSGLTTEVDIPEEGLSQAVPE